jgi:hypothetical protein
MLALDLAEDEPHRIAIIATAKVELGLDQLMCGVERDGTS